MPTAPITDMNAEQFSDDLLAGKYDDHLKLVAESEDVPPPSREVVSAKLDQLAAQGFNQVVTQNEYGGYWAVYAWDGTPIEWPHDDFLPTDRNAALEYFSPA